MTKPQNGGRYYVSESVIYNNRRRLAEEGSEAEQVRAAVKTAVACEPPKPGNILAALRRSPLVGVDLDLRPCEEGRKVDL